MADLTNIGKILAVIGGILMVVNGILHIIGDVIGGVVDILNIGGPSAGNFAGAGDIVAAIIQIVIGIILIFIYTGRFSVGEKLLLGIVVLVLGIVGGGLGGLLAIIGGILIIIDNLS